jgi:hypothetical protein
MLQRRRASTERDMPSVPRPVRRVCEGASSRHRQVRRPGSGRSRSRATGRPSTGWLAGSPPARGCRARQAAQERLRRLVADGRSHCGWPARRGAGALAAVTRAPGLVLTEPICSIRWPLSLSPMPLNISGVSGWVWLTGAIRCSIRDTPAGMRALTGRAGYGEHHGDSCAQGCVTPSQQHDQPDAAGEHFGSQQVRFFGAQSPWLWLCR